MLTAPRGDGGAGAMEVEAPGQFIGQEGEVHGLAVGQEIRQESVGGSGPVGAMSAAGGLEAEVVLVGEPLVAQFVEAGATDHEALGGGGGVELAGVEGGEDVLDVEGLGAMSELFFFMGPKVAAEGSAPKGGKFIALDPG